MDGCRCFSLTLQKLRRWGIYHSLSAVHIIRSNYIFVILYPNRQKYAIIHLKTDDDFHMISRGHAEQESNRKEIVIGIYRLTIKFNSDTISVKLIVYNMSFELAEYIIKL